MSDKQHQPWLPVKYDLSDAGAVQAFAHGRATAEQQRIAFRWIVEKAAGTYDQSYHPGGEGGRRNTDFAEGRRFVGNTLVKLTRLNLSTLRRKESEDQ